MQKSSLLNRTGPFIYALAIAAFGFIQLATQNFLTGLLPVPPHVPLRHLLMYTSSIVLIIAGIGIALDMQKKISLLTAGIIFFIFLLFLHVPLLSADIKNGGEWAATLETVALASGAFIIAWLLPNQKKIVPPAFSKICWWLFSLVWLGFCIQHINYNDYIQTLIPAWMPGNVFLSWIVITGYLLTSVSFLIRKKVFLSSFLLGTMFLLWVFLLHAPRSFSKLTVEPEWSSLFVALAMSGIAYSIVFNMDNQPFLSGKHFKQ